MERGPTDPTLGEVFGQVNQHRLVRCNVAQRRVIVSRLREPAACPAEVGASQPIEHGIGNECVDARGQNTSRPTRT
jgi:hypothetical protein